MIEAGYHKAKAKKAEMGYTSNGNEQIAMLVEFVGGPNDNKLMTWYGYFSEKTADRTLESLMIAGWDGDNLAELAGLGSTEFTAVVEPDTYQGETKMRINWINRLEGRTPALANKMDAGSKAAFAEKMRGRALALKQKSPVQPEAASVQQDDIPF